MSLDGNPAESLATADQGLAPRARRREGAFYTPAPWAEEAVRRIDGLLGPGWAKDTLVWDCACGTGNLVRGLPLPHLLLSTLKQGDVSALSAEGIAPEATSFAWNFLDEPADPSLLPTEARRALEEAADSGKRLLFLINPPYGTAGNMKKGARKKTNIARWRAGAEMRRLGLGGPAQQLYAQFLFRIGQWGEVLPWDRLAVGVFSKPAFLCARSFAAFREHWLDRFVLRDGFLLQANAFAQVRGSWGVSFTLWESGLSVEREKHRLDLCVSGATHGIEVISQKTFQAPGARAASRWIREPLGHIKTTDGPQLSSGLKLRTQGRGRAIEGSLGYFVNDSNDVYHSPTTVWLQSAGPSASNHLGGIFLLPQNIERCIALFAARKLVRPNWINDKDEFLAPSDATCTSTAYRQWSADLLVWSLLHSANQCVGWRGLQYKGHAYDLYNALFWCRAEDLAAQASATQWGAFQEDLSHHQNHRPWAAEAIERCPPSADAGDLLQQATDLLLASLPQRKLFAEKNPQLHLHCWDAGWYQLKHLIQSASPREWRALRSAHQGLGNRLRSGVYRFGFLPPEPGTPL